MSRRLGLALALAVVVTGIGLELAGFRVRQLERGELEHESRWQTLSQLRGQAGATRVSVRLTTVELRSGEGAVFELCSKDALEPAGWQGALELAVFRLPNPELMLRVPLDREHLLAARRNAQGACLPLGGGRIERGGSYSLDAVWTSAAPSPALERVPLQARVLARKPLASADRGYVLAIALGVALGLAALLTTRGARSFVALAGRGAWTRASMRWTAALAGLALLFAAIQLPTSGATLTLLKGIGLVALQALAAFGLARTLPSSPWSALALSPPARVARWCGIALLAAAVLAASAKLSLRLVPTTGEAPIQTFIAWPSGMLCFAVLGVVLPLGEELFFRGYLYGAALALGRGAAFALTLLAFVALHAQQSWGNWGGLIAIGVTGTVLTALRAISGSVLVPLIAHVLYNFALSMASF